MNKFVNIFILSWQFIAKIGADVKARIKIWLDNTKAFFLYSLFSLVSFIKFIKGKTSIICSSCLIWVKKNKVTAIVAPILFIIAIIFNVFKRPHTNECITTGDSKIFDSVMGLLSIILTLSITRLLRNGTSFFKFIVFKFLHKEEKDKRKKETSDIQHLYFLYIFLLIFLLIFPIQYWYASYQIFHTKTDWSFSHVILHMIAPIMFYIMAEIVFSPQENITRENYSNSKKIAAYFIIAITIMNIIVDFITLHQSTIFTSTNGLRTMLLPLILLLGVIRLPRKMLFDVFIYIFAILLFAAFIFLN